MAMSPRKKMAMGKDGGKQKSAVKLRAGGMVKKMAKGGAAKAPETSPRPVPNPRRSDPVSRGNKEDMLEGQEYNEVLRNGGRGARPLGRSLTKKRMGGMVKK